GHGSDRVPDHITDPPAIPDGQAAPRRPGWSLVRAAGHLPGPVPDPRRPPRGDHPSGRTPTGRLPAPVAIATAQLPGVPICRIGSAGPGAIRPASASVY